MPPEQQDCLTEALEDGSIGARRISACGPEIDQALADERFRADFHYRLDLIEIPGPPFREWPGDAVWLMMRMPPKPCAGPRSSRRNTASDPAPCPARIRPGRTPRRAAPPGDRRHSARDTPAFTHRSGIELSIDATPRTRVRRPTRKVSNAFRFSVTTRSR